MKYPTKLLYDADGFNSSLGSGAKASTSDGPRDEDQERGTPEYDGEQRVRNKADQIAVVRVDLIEEKPGNRQQAGQENHNRPYEGQCQGLGKRQTSEPAKHRSV